MTHLSLLCRLQQGREHRPCSGTCDGHGTDQPCDQPCECACHDEVAPDATCDHGEISSYVCPVCQAPGARWWHAGDALVQWVLDDPAYRDR